MSDISEWSTIEEENTHIDELTLSGEGALYINKLMCAVKAKTDEVDARLDAVAGGLVFRGTKSTYAELAAVESPSVGDMYSVTELGGENYAWDGESWDALGTSDANVVHKTGTEEISGAKTFADAIKISGNMPFATLEEKDLDITNVSGSSYSALAYTDKNSNVVGSLAVQYKSGTCAVYQTANYGTGDSKISAQVELISGDGVKAFMPRGSNGQIDLGYSTNRWSTVYASTGSIDTSDARLKECIADIPDEVLDAWGELKWVQYKFKDAVKEKGFEKARTHNGLIAQDISEVFTKNGIDPNKYGFFCWDKWDSKDAILDKDNNVVFPETPAGDQYALRYIEALSIEAAYQRRRADRLEARIAVLEARADAKH